MILFSTERWQMCNHILHHLLRENIFYDGAEEMEIDDYVDEIFPTYLRREQFAKCKKTLRELFYWTEDTFYHSMTAFHERALFGFLTYMRDLQRDEEDFRETYFDETCHEMIRKAAEEDYREWQEEVAAEKEYQQNMVAEGCQEDLEDIEMDWEDITLEECQAIYYNMNYYMDVLFEEWDFLSIDSLYNARKCGVTMIEEMMGIHLDYYFDLLPLDIQEQYQNRRLTLTGEISAFLQYLAHRMHHGNLYRLFWENDQPVKESRVQLILENMMDAYFHRDDIDIIREPMVGDGKVDFKVFRGDQTPETVLIEVKMAKNADLKKGYEKQLTEYMHATDCDNAFYLVACFNDEELERTNKFIHENIYTDTIQLYINIAILDLRKRKAVSA